MKVIVIDSNPSYGTGFSHFPPVGAVGQVVSELDECNEFDVLFDGYPCLPLDPTWITHRNMVVILPDETVSKRQVAETCTN